MGFWEFVLCLVGIGTIGGVLKSWGRSSHGLRGKHGRAFKADFEQQNAELRAENARLRERLELHEDRLITLERIVTDSGYDVARQIERLRDVPTPASRIETGRELGRN